jgi:hypothetical protein
MNALKASHAALLCVLILSGTAIYIHLDNKAQRIKQAEKPAVWQPPATDKIISEADPLGILRQKKSLTLDQANALVSGKQMPDTLTSEEADALIAPNQKKLLTDEAVGFVPAATNANGTPVGAWAATLVRITNAIESNLFSDPATGKLVHLVNGQFFEEKNPYMALTPQAISYLTKLRLAEQQQQPKVVVQMLPPLQTHDYMSDYYLQSYQHQILQQNQQTIFQNQQAIDEMRLLRHDYEWNNTFKR